MAAKQKKAEFARLRNDDATGGASQKLASARLVLLVLSFSDWRL